MLGEPYDKRTDVFSLGVLFWEMITRTDGRKFCRKDYGEGYSFDTQHAISLAPEDAPPGTVLTTTQHNTTQHNTTQHNTRLIQTHINRVVAVSE